MAYKDELCIKSFSDLLTYDEAKDFCAGQGSPSSTSSLVLVKEADHETFLEVYTEDMFEYLWLGGKYDVAAAEFRWSDGEPLSYTNWAEGYPRILNTSNSCIELRPPNAKLSNDTEGKWADVNCERRNRVICQRVLSWSLDDAIAEIIRNRKQHQEDMELVRAELQATRNELQLVTSRVVPVGAIYLEYFTQSSPTTLWPNLTWEDVSNTYAGQFFRVSGGESAEWGVTQNGCAPGVTQRQFGWSREDIYQDVITFPSNGWSAYGHAGNHGSWDRYEAARFYTEGCEVRPVNQAIRVWKRTA